MDNGGDVDATHNGRNGFTEKQRKWMIERDGGKCVLCGSKESLHVHHCRPFRYSMTYLKWTLQMTNSMVNGITLCESCHNGGKQNQEFCVHPDVARAKHRYHEDKTSFDDMFEKREDLCREGKIYWNSANDNFFIETAFKNTIEFIIGGSVPEAWGYKDVPF